MTIKHGMHDIHITIILLISLLDCIDKVYFTNTIDRRFKLLSGHREYHTHDVFVLDADPSRCKHHQRKKQHHPSPSITSYGLKLQKFSQSIISYALFSWYKVSSPRFFMHTEVDMGSMTPTPPGNGGSNFLKSMLLVAFLLNKQAMS
jgi:hypothetical protein